MTEIKVPNKVKIIANPDNFPTVEIGWEGWVIQVYTDTLSEQPYIAEVLFPNEKGDSGGYVGTFDFSSLEKIDDGNVIPVWVAYELQ